MELGQIVEFRTLANRHKVGVVVGLMGKKKLSVFTEDAAKLRVAKKSVTQIFDERLERYESKPDLEVELRRMRARIERAKQLIDVVEIWQLIRELDDAVASAEEIADLVFEAADPVRIVAVNESLRADRLYFKPHDDLWYALSQEELDERQGRKRPVEHVFDEIAEFIALMRGVLELPESIQRGKCKELRARNDLFGEYFGVLQGYASCGDDFSEKKKANKILDALETLPGVKLHGRDSLRAFHLLVELGVWDPHENLQLHRYEVNTDFPKELLEAAKAARSDGWAPESWRRDLTRTLCFSIDHETTLDIDDALSCSPRIEGGWVLGIHIADPGAFVPNATPLDDEARARGTSIYLPTGVLPMFPIALSEDAMSLVQGEVRPALTTSITFDQDFNIVDFEIFPSLVEVNHRLTYDEVDAILERSPASALDAALRDLYFLASEFYQERMGRGAIQLDIPDVKILADMTSGEPDVSISVLEAFSPSQTLVSEAMILANTSMAEFCYKNRIPVIFRSQDAPEQNLYSAEVTKYPEGIAREFALRRRMKRGNITTFPERHFGLGVDMYVQATSPIRRYSDLICQRQVKAFLLGEELPYTEDEILTIAAIVENTTREAQQIERSTKQYWTRYFLEQRVGKTVRATLLSARDEKLAYVFVHEIAARIICEMPRWVEPGEEFDVLIEQANARADLLMTKAML